MTASAVNSQTKIRKRGKAPKKHRFYNPRIGEVECTTKELWECNTQTRGVKYGCKMFYALTSGDILKLGEGDDYWILVESDDLVGDAPKNTNQHGRKPQKYKFYNLEKGEIECTVKQLQRQYFKEKSIAGVHALTRGQVLRIGKGDNRWVLAENKDLLTRSSVCKGVIPKKHKFYNPEIGEVECTTKKLWEQYIKKKGYSLSRVEALASGSVLVLGKGDWMLAKNRLLYEEGMLLYKEKTLRLIHPEMGIKEFTRKEFLQEIGGTKQGVSLLVMGKLKSYKGWSILI
ncbi:hypothetical protein QT972_26890 [Microcoleus sp. herbarium7]|uniref:hypothetical protein n=1 Tax=Microcoleus sp. herbarium7 TaxID=3055435 RepID=UPI002FD73B64